MDLSLVVDGNKNEVVVDEEDICFDAIHDLIKETVLNELKEQKKPTLPFIHHHNSMGECKCVFSFSILFFSNVFFFCFYTDAEDLIPPENFYMVEPGLYRSKCVDIYI